MNLLWTIILLNLILVDGESSGDTAEPAITLLSRVTKDKKVNMTCVAEFNVRGSALTFIAPLGGNYKDFTKHVSIYTSANGFLYPRDPYDCDLKSTCARGWNEPVIEAMSGLHDLAPVTDERWESKLHMRYTHSAHLLLDFPTYYSKNNTVTYNFGSDNRSIGLSVRTMNEVYLKFCYNTWNNKSKKYDYFFCYWILLNDNTTNIMTLWLCNTYSDKDPRTNLKYCSKLKSDSTTIINFTESYWTHFKLTISMYEIKVEYQNTTLLYFKASSYLAGIKQISLKSSKWAIWKIHEYGYLSIEQRRNGDWQPIGPTLQAEAAGFVCVELYAVTCSTCTFRFRLHSSSEQKEIHGNPTQSMQHWKLIRLETRTTGVRNYQLEVQVSGGAGGYWLIGTVRRCHEQETRTISLTVPMSDKDVISCQSLNQPDRWSSIKAGKIQNTNLEVCSNVTYTGSKCSVSCLSALGTDCRNVIVCEPSTNRFKPKCSCTTGYTGEQCQHILHAPHNLNMGWVNHKVMVTWDHVPVNVPIKDNISYKLSINLISSILNSKPYFNKTYTIPKQANDHCSFEVPDDLPRSSTYQVDVNPFYGEVSYPPASLEVASPAVTPWFTGHVTCGTHTNTTQDITIPVAHPDTITTRSFFYILICNLTHTTNSVNKENFHSKLHSWSKCTGTSWIAANLTVTTSAPMNFIVGQPGNQSTNKPLTPDSYTINIIFVNVYKGDEKYDITSATSTITRSTSTTNSNESLNEGTNYNPAFYALLLLLFIPAIVLFIVWKKRYSKKPPEMSVSYQAVSTTANIQISNNNSTQDNLLIIENNDSLILKNKEANLQNKIAANNIPTDNIDNEHSYSKVVAVNNFLNYVKESLQNSELENQFELLPKGSQKSNNIGTSNENAAKNRYKNLSAYDHSRVILEKIPGDKFSDFINANYIDGYKQQKAYIATQGPKKSTLFDFWRMVWQEKVECIVMLTNLIEEGKIKCEKYWPDVSGETVNYGDIYVTLVDIDTYADFEYRIFNVQKGDTSRKVQQYHFTSWPDHGVPLYPQALVPFLDKLNAVSTAQAPIVVHCSAGVGRTGTIILADICLRMAAAEKKIDVLKYYYIMRENRCNMVASYDQYELVHMVLLEYLFASRNSIPCIELSKTVDQLIRKRTTTEQMKYLENTAWQTQGGSAVAEVNEDLTSKAKNRFPDIVPNRRRIYLSKNGFSNSSDYINAVPVDGYRNKGQFIVTQNPLQSTIKDFWQMVSEFNVEVIVSLNEISKKNEFWPHDKKEMSVSPNLTLKFISIIDESFYSIYKLHLINTKYSDDDAIRSITVTQFKNWKYKDITPSDEKEIIDFVEITTRHVTPIVVTCFDGARASGLYVALSFVLEKIKLEQVCDVCLAVRIVRNNRDQFVNDIKQFEFLYKVAVKYVSLFELYSNFEK